MHYYHVSLHYSGATNIVTDCKTNLTTSAAVMPVHITVRSYSLLFPNDIDHVNCSQRVQLRLVQSDHRGGFCDCWAVSNLNISSETLNQQVTVTQVVK